MKYLIIKSLRFKPAARRTKAAQSEAEVWIDLTRQNKEQNSPIIEFFDVFRQFQEDHVPATSSNRSKSILFKFQVPTWNRPKVGSDDESTNPSSSLSIRKPENDSNRCK